MTEDVFQKFHYSNHDDTWGIETYQDIGPYLRANKRMYNDNQTNKHSSAQSKGVMGWHKASIPEVILHQWMKEFQTMTNDPLPPRLSNPDFKLFMQKRLRDPEYRHFRVDGRRD